MGGEGEADVIGYGWRGAEQKEKPEFQGNRGRQKWRSYFLQEDDYLLIYWGLVSTEDLPGETQ